MEAIRYYVRGAFQSVPATPAVLEQQDELVADLSAKVADLVAEGRSEQEALGLAIASVGDLSALVSEFEMSAADAAVATPTAWLFSTRLDLHAVAISASIGAAVMVASAALGALTELVHPAAGLSLIAVLAVGLAWVRGAYLRYAESPDAVSLRELVFRVRFRQALLLWVGISFLSLVLNGATSNSGFWAWPLWVAGGTWALSVKVEQRLSERSEFRAPDPQPAGSN